MSDALAAEDDWRPSCDLEQLRLRAQLLAETREFFALRSVLEVETPLLAPATGTDPQLDFFDTQLLLSKAEKWFLQTSPEFAMKRLLASGSGSIYQVCKAFRRGEVGRFHNPEFTMLEWYRLDFNLADLMAEVAELFYCWFSPFKPLLSTQTFSYRDIFYQYTGLDTLKFDVASYQAYALAQSLADAPRLCGTEHALWLDFLFSHQVQPHLGIDRLAMIYDYPACQASLARLKQSDLRVAERVELFMAGVELGNGFFELCDVEEQAKRFEQEIRYRQQHGLPAVKLDHKLLAALRSGLPSCSGIAIGLDRVLMLLSDSVQIEDVLSFSARKI